jgi:transcriptional regulator with XRE-family HTH domain
MEYKQRLAHAMTLAGMDRQALAAGLKISVQAVSQALGGKTRALTAENTAKAAMVLGVDAYWLATGEGEPRPALMAERAALSPSAVRFGVAFDALDERERQVWQSLVEAAKAVAAQPTADFHTQAVEMHGIKGPKPEEHSG